MREVGVPGLVVRLMRFMPGWGKMTAVAATLPHDLTLMAPHQQGRPIPEGYFAEVQVPTLVLVGGRSPEWMRSAQQALADAVPGAEHRSLDGQTHMVKAKVVGPVLAEWFGRS